MLYLYHDSWEVVPYGNKKTKLEASNSLCCHVRSIDFGLRMDFNSVYRLFYHANFCRVFYCCGFRLEAKLYRNGSLCWFRGIGNSCFCRLSSGTCCFFTGNRRIFVRVCSFGAHHRTFCKALRAKNSGVAFIDGAVFNYLLCMRNDLVPTIIWSLCVRCSLLVDGDQRVCIPFCDSRFTENDIGDYTDQTSFSLFEKSKQMF